MALQYCRNLDFNEAGSLIKSGMGTNLFFALSVIVRSLIYLTFGLPFIVFFYFQFIVFILCFDITADSFPF